MSVSQDSHSALLQRRLWVASQFRRGMTLERMIEAAPFARPVALDERDVRVLYKEVRDRAKARLAEEIEFARAEQGERLRARMTEILAGEPMFDRMGLPRIHPDGSQIRRINFTAYMMVEREYSAIFGTHSPTKLKIDFGEGAKEVAANLAATIAGLGEEHLQRIADEQRQRERDAQEFRRLKLLPGGRGASSS